MRIHPDDEHPLSPGKDLVQGLGERDRAVGIVSDVDHGRRSAIEDLEAARVRHLSERLGDKAGVGGLTEEAVERRQCAGGVSSLVRAAEGNEKIVVPASGRDDGDAPTFRIRGARQQLELFAEAPGRRADLGALRFEDGADGRVLFADDRHCSRLDDARLLLRDQLPRRAEIVGVVKGNVGDDRDRAVYHVRRVETAAETHLEDE